MNAKKLDLYQITVENDGEMSMYFSEFRAVSFPLSNIRKIVNRDEYYLVYTKGKYGRFVIQKNLILRGTIEEFESIYAEVLINEMQ